MSYVSGVTLQWSLADDLFEDEERGGPRSEQPCPKAIAEWLDVHGLAPMARLEHAYSGNKHPQIYVMGAGYNYFPEDEFAAFVLSLPWTIPENVVLTISPEEGPTRIWRPEGF